MSVDSRYLTDLSSRALVIFDINVLVLSNVGSEFAYEMVMTDFESQYIDSRVVKLFEKAVSSKPVSFEYQSPILMVFLRVGSIEPFKNPLDTRKLESSSYHALGACLSPYKSSVTIGLIGNDLCVTYARNSRTASNQATRANDSSKSIPSCWFSHVLPRGTTWLPRGSGGHPLTRLLTGGQPPLTGGPRFGVRGNHWCIRFDRYEVLEADVAACDWWIEGMTAAYD
ncbi:hypothetical protein Tco_0721248 [Tanacetum coccineum]